MIKLQNVKFAYRVNGKVFSITTDKSASNQRVSLDISYENGLFSASVKTRTPIELLRLSAEFEYIYTVRDRIFLNGYQSWTDSIEHRPDSVMMGIDQIPAPIAYTYAFSQYGDYNFTRYSHKRGVMHGYSYGYIRNEEHYDLIGSLSENSGFTCIRTNISKNRLMAFKDCHQLRVNSEFEGLKLYFGEGTQDQVFDGYFAALDIPKPDAKPIFGYTSWYKHYQDISEEKLINDLEGILDCEHKADVFQIDDGYQTAVGDWLSIDEEKFPNSLKPISQRISQAGLIPGLWLAPFVCEEKSEIFKNHRDWIVTNEKGGLVKGGSNWSGFYALDIYNPEVRDHLKKVFDTVINDWGFKLLKLDFLYAACLQPREEKTRGMVMCDAMDLLRELTKGAQILGCGVPLASAFGKVDYCRIGCDVTLDWDDKPYMKLMHRERTSTRNSILNSVFRRQLDGRAFLNDPDVFLLRSDNTALTEVQKQTLAEINSLTGSVLFTSDSLKDYTDAQNLKLNNLLAFSTWKVTAAELNGKELSLTVSNGSERAIRVYRV